MKKFSNYFFVAIAALTMVFTSCNPDEDDPLGPNITFKATAGYTIGDDVVDAGDTVRFSWEVIKGDANLAQFTIRDAESKNLGDFPNTDIDKDQYEDEANFVLNTAGDYKFTFIATDKDGLEDIVTINITAESDLESQGAATLGAGASTLGSYYSVVDGVEMDLSEANTSPEKVDIVFTSTATEAVLKSPNKAAAAKLIAEDRTTTYKKVTLDFTTASSVDLVGVTPTADEIVIAQGDVIVFETEDGTKGILKIVALAVASDGTVTIDAKVKK